MKQIKMNTILYTKDGRKIGNAIVTNIIGNFYELKTDYGNSLKLNSQELRELFYSEMGGLTQEDEDYLGSTHKNMVNGTIE